MDGWIAVGIFILFFLASVALFFFLTTRGALLARTRSSNSRKSHVYPIYTNMRLMKLVDFQPIISAILLFQYRRLVSKIVFELGQCDLGNKKVLITSCAFGNVIPRIVRAAFKAKASRVLIADIISNQLIHARNKLGEHSTQVDFIEEDAMSMRQEDGMVDVNIIFFLLHELPDDLKVQALCEAGRLLAAGGKLFIAEFHRPKWWVLRALSWIYFKVFEPLGLTLWDTHDPAICLENMGGWTCERTTYFFGNFQIVSATKR